MYQFKVDGMGCNSCVRKITQSIQARDPDAIVEIDLASKQVRVDSALSDSAISGIIMNLGYYPQTKA